MKELLIALMVWASPVAGLPVPSEQPRIVLADHCDIQDIVYEGMNRECQEDGAQALYMHESDTIYLPDTWTPEEPYYVAMLLHELVHFMQDQAGKDAGNVKCVASELEKPAYDVHFKWLAASGLDPWKTSNIDPLTLMFTTQCMDRPGYE